MFSCSLKNNGARGRGERERESGKGAIRKLDSSIFRTSPVSKQNGRAHIFDIAGNLGNVMYIEREKGERRRSIGAMEQSGSAFLDVI